MVRDDASLEWPSGTTWAGWTRTFLPADLDGVGTLREAVAHATEAEADALDKLAWLGLFDEVKGPASLEGTPAQIVEALVTDRWVLGANDRDMIVMWHKFEYDLEGERKAKTSSLSLEGKDSTFTAMSDTVGLPMALAVKPMLEDTFGTTGVDVPMSKTYYAPLLAGLAQLGIVFEEREIEA
jgi:saccharopine dehydrogenase-like NADP-dependent oxidoreductase